MSTTNTDWTNPDVVALLSSSAQVAMSSGPSEQVANAAPKKPIKDVIVVGAGEL
jgi:hypothetical protein